VEGYHNKIHEYRKPFGPLGIQGAKRQTNRRQNIDIAGLQDYNTAYSYQGTQLHILESC